MKEPYSPELTPAEQARKLKFEEWESFKGQWRHKETGEIRMWHPMVVDMGEHIYKATKKFIPNKKSRS